MKEKELEIGETASKICPNPKPKFFDMLYYFSRWREIARLFILFGAW